MRPDLDKRKWAVPLNLDPRFNRSPLMARLYQPRWQGLVSEGYIIAKELAIRGSNRAIPPGECAITSLAVGGGWVFGATSGRRAHVFAYCPQSQNEVVLDLGALDRHTGVRHALVWLPGHGLFAGTSAPGRPEYAGGEVLKVEAPRYIGSLIQEWNPVQVKVEPFGVPVAGEGLACLIGDAQRGRLYGLSDRTGTLFSVDAASGRTQAHGAIDEMHRFSPELILGQDGFVYGCGTCGRLVRFDPEAQSLSEVDLNLPHMAGRAQYCKVGAWVADAGGLIYAGDMADGLLSVLDLARGEARPLGRPTSQPHVRALAVGADGQVYGVAGLPGTICHLFRYTPSSGEMRDLGVMASATERRWYGYEFDSAAAGADGRIYFGESDRISHLFVYFPPFPVARRSDPLG